MKTIRTIGLMTALTISISQLNAQQAYNEGVVSYNIAVNTGNNEAKAADLLDGATQKIWFKGVNTRTELTSILGKTVTLHDSRAGNAVVMNEYGDQKILIKMTKENYEDRNSKYMGIQFELLPDTKEDPWI
ncbi:MAG: hypothetical protein IPK31_00640 [Chitinophagaceae bacterium]|nr:hypothetical protein [Chitinophagaceae bacterium]